MRVAKLEFDYDYDFLLFGISSHVKDYRFCWAMNRQLGINLVKEDDICVNDTDPPRAFSCYSCENETQRIKHIVVANRGEVGYLVNEHKQADYFLLLEGLYSLVDKAELLRMIREPDLVLTAFELDPKELKSRQNLIFE